MKTPCPTQNPVHPRVSRLSLRRLTQLSCLIALAALVSAPSTARAQTETFDAGSGIFTPGANGWLMSALNPALVTFSYPPNPGNGLAVRMQANPIVGAAPGVGFIYRTNIYHDWYVAIDVVAYASLDQALLLIAHGANVAPPSDFSGYIINYDVLQDGQAPTDRLGSQFQLNGVIPPFSVFSFGISEFTLVDGGRYRFVLRGVDNGGIFDITAEAYDHTDLTKPLVRLFGQDSTYVDGLSGLGNFSRNGNVAASVTDSTFDNYFAGVTDPNTDIAPAIRHPLVGTAQVVARTPSERFTNFYPPASGINFTARTFTPDNINASATKLYLNNVDATSSLSTPASAPTVSYTTPTSPLLPNKVYTGRIEVESVTGLKGTNIFWFDTFSDAYLASSAVKTIECEEYNYQNGLWQADPIPVSGFDTNGNMINGAGVGYFDLVGTEGVDYDDNRSTPEGGFNHFRSLDFVSTWQGEYEIEDSLNPPPINPWDPPLVPGNTRAKYETLGMKEYEVVRTEANEWMNYTRLFANQNYNVYLRASSFGATEVKLDTVTSDPTLPGQTTTPLGRFYVPNQFRRDNYRYTPLMAAGVPAVVNLAGTKTIRLTMGGVPTKHNRLVYLNYLLFVPTTDAVTSPVVLETSATVNGVYANAAGASVNLSTKTIIVPTSGSTRFYRIRSDVPTTISTINVVGPSVVITYN